MTTAIRHPQSRHYPPTLLLALALGLAACQSGDTGQRTAIGSHRWVDAIVLVTVGGLRADVDLAGGEANPGPLASLGREGLVFDRAYAPSSLPVQTLASISVGRLPTRGGAIGITEAQPAAEASTMATRLRRQGWATGWVAQEPWASRPGFTRGFDLVETAREQPLSASEVTTRALRSLGALANWDGASGFFLAVHYSGPSPSAELTPSTDAKEARSDYLAQMSETLGQVARLIGKIGALGDEPLVVLAGASGYELLEHGGLGSGWTVYEEVVHVPLVLHLPSLLAPGRVASPVSLAELTPTLLSLAGAHPIAKGDSEPSDIFDGESLLELEDGKATPNPSNRPRIAEVVVLERAISRAVIGQQFKYLRTSRTAPPLERAAVARGIEELQAAMLSGAIEAPPLFGEAIEELLFDLDADPQEQTSILDRNPHQLSELKAALRSYRRRYEGSAYSPTEITRRLEIDPSQVRELEALGYL